MRSHQGNRCFEARRENRPELTRFKRAALYPFGRYIILCRRVQLMTQDHGAALCQVGEGKTANREVI
jgi:hypothetical protein